MGGVAGVERVSVVMDAMTDEERAIVKGCGIPEDWKAKPAKLVQKDRDARWTLILHG